MVTDEDEERALEQAWQHADETAMREATYRAWQAVKHGEYTESDVKLIEAVLRRAGEL